MNENQTVGPGGVEYRAWGFQRGETVPNNPSLPLLLYEKVFSGNSDLAGRFEEHYDRHGWGGTWRNGIFPYHHYHSTAHEVLGIARGTAEVRFGGPQGKTVGVEAGDLAILPAGTGHKRIQASRDLLVVGGYSRGQNADLVRADSPPSPDVLESIRTVSLPESCPVLGTEGPLIDEWNSSRA